MRAVDTNVVVRYIIRDDEQQTPVADAVFDGEPIFITKTVLLEVEWVLRNVYKVPRPNLMRILHTLAGIPGVTFETPEQVASALAWADDGMDFADALHLAAASAASPIFLTFDRALVRKARGRSGIPVQSP